MESASGGNEDQEAAFRRHKEAAYRAFTAARLWEAEQELRAGLRIHPEDPDLNRALAMLLNSEGRRWEAAPFGFMLLKVRRFSIDDLALLANTDEIYENTPLLKKALRVEPASRIPLLGLARFDRSQKRDREAQEKLEEVLRSHPDLVEAQVQYGTLLLDLGRDDAFLTWRRELPDVVLEHPETWFLFGRWAESNDECEAAARCYWEAIDRDPNHRRAHFKLAAVLKRLGRREEADLILRRSEDLTELNEVVHPIMITGPDVKKMQRIVELCESLGRIWEAWGWCVATAYTMKSNGLDPGTWIAKRDALKQRLAPDLPRVLPEARLSKRVDLHAWPLPSWKARSKEKPAPAPAVAGGLIRWRDLAEEAGLQFTYYDSAADRPDGIQIMDSTGGGVAVLDYDQDGWPDIYLTQCHPWPPGAGQDEHRDRLFRNRGDGTFEDVTERAGIDERGFSQGCTSGDFNNDGWPDLYVANIGPNRLFLNNGDGTFSAVALPKDSKPMVWTTSVALVDLNQDGLPDIYDVNYLGGNYATLRCGTPEHRKSCGPSAFPGEQDRVLINTGDGGWREVTRDSGLTEHTGKGLGIVIVDFNGDGRMEVFVANDGEANFLLVNENTEPGGVPRWKDEALLRGLAFNRDGAGQACMGIAVDDVDGDGQLDLFVTNYYDDHNTLYLQELEGLFLDKTREFGLYEPSLKQLGFGTQFVDADLDGRPDLLIANGHVDDFRDEGKPFRMRPQFFYNTGSGRFVEGDPAKLGDFFGGKYLGRGMAVVDWNGDGREDVVVSQIGDPAALLTNETAETGHFVAIELRDTHGSRDAYGATVEVHTAGTVRVRQLVGGSGYQACNQRQLIFGLGDAERIDKVVVRWPDGSRSEFADVPADRRWRILQGVPRLFSVDDVE